MQSWKKMLDYSGFVFWSLYLFGNLTWKDSYRRQATIRVFLKCMHKAYKHGAAEHQRQIGIEMRLDNMFRSEFLFQKTLLTEIKADKKLIWSFFFLLTV